MPDTLCPKYVDGTVFPGGPGARFAVNEIVESAVRTLEDVSGELEIVAVEIAPDAPVAGPRLDETRLPRGSLIVSDADGSRIGGPDTLLCAGDRHVVAVESDVADGY